MGEGGFERIHASEIFFLILIGFAQHAMSVEVEYNFAEVLGAGDSPFSENGPGNGAELLKGELPDAVQELRPADMPGRTLGGLLQFFDSMVQSEAEKDVGLTGVTGVFLKEQGDGFFELAALHGVGSGGVR